MKRICVIVTARPSWAKLQTVCEAIHAHADLDLQIVACASALLERYGHVDRVIEQAGFPITERVYSVYEGATLETSVLETGALCSALGRTLARLQPDAVLVMADRHEVLAAAQAVSYLHIPLVHCQGGERTGSIDDKVRDSITALADYHFTATEQAKYRVYGLTGAMERIWNVGCPSIDIACRAHADPPVTAGELGGAGDPFDDACAEPYAVVLQHPNTQQVDEAYAQMRATLGALYMADLDAIVFWPGQDAGADGASKAIREAVASENRPAIHTVRNLPPARFLRLLTQARVVVGNSSAGIREAGYLGVPVVNCGTRQFGRERGPNVLDVPHDFSQIAAAIREQVAHGRYPCSTLYGTGEAGQRIAEVLADVTSDRLDSRPVRLEGHPGQEFAPTWRALTHEPSD